MASSLVQRPHPMIGSLGKVISYDQYIGYRDFNVISAFLVWPSRVSGRDSTRICSNFRNNAFD